jgi:hypothetical protein
MTSRLAPLLLALLALVGCVKDNGASIEIFETCFPPAPDTNGGCSWPATCTATPLGTYVIDVGGTDYLFLGIQVNNNLPNNADASSGRLNTNDVFIDTFTVDYEVSGVSGVSVPSISGPTQIQNTVPAGGDGVVGVDLLRLDPTTLAALNTAVAGLPAGETSFRIVATMRLHGVLGDTSKFETAPRKFGVDVCVGCMGVPACGSGKVAAACPQFFQYPVNEACISTS